MKLFVKLFLIVLLFSCGGKTEKTSNKSNLKKQKEVSELKVKKKVLPSKKISHDTLNNKNTVSFFTAYGKENKETIVAFSTRLGNFTVKLYNDVPVHRANFIFLAKKGYFDTTSFHRLVPGFVAQFGNSDRLSTVKFRNKYKHYRLKPEFRKNHKHKRGALAAARDWENNPEKLSTPFEFYIVQSRKGEHHLNFEHTVFGEVISGMSVIDKIILEKTDKDEWPFVDVDLKVLTVK